MPRFVVQQHFREADYWHYDLMLERADALVTFSCPTPPEDLERLPTLVHHLGDHRLAYLEHEGQVSNDRGWCKIHDRGTFDWVAPKDPAHIETVDEVRVRLDGLKAKGEYVLRRETKSGADYWRLSTKGSA